MKKMKCLQVAICSLLICCSGAWAGSLEDGVAAFKAKDFVKAMKLLQIEADRGVATAQGLLARMYANSWGTVKDQGAAIKWANLAAAQGDKVGQAILGSIYLRGDGIKKDEKEAFNWYRLAADQGDASAQTALALMYREGLGAEKNLNAALKWYELAADQGNAVAQRSLGSMYRQGLGVEKNFGTALKWYQLAADQGDAASQRFLGSMYRSGFGVEINFAEAVKWFQLAADQGDAAAQTNLAQMYRQGLGVEKNLVAALKWFRLAADQGNAAAQGNLGNMYDIGLGVTTNKDEALKWFRLSAGGGFALGQQSLGNIYEKGLGVAQDLQEARRWYLLAAAQGSEPAKESVSRLDAAEKAASTKLAQAKIAETNDVERKRQEASARVSSTSTQLPATKNEYEAFELVRMMNEAIKKSDPSSAEEIAENIFIRSQNDAKKGEAWAQYSLGRMYEEGFGIKEDKKLAAIWFQKAAEQGSADGQFRLHTYLTKVDPRQSIFWLKMSADQGWGVAQFVLGLGYAGGFLLSKDEQMGYFWLLLASRDGSQKVKDTRDGVGGNLTGAQRSEMQTKATNWLPKASSPVRYAASVNAAPSVEFDSSKVESTGSGFLIARGYVVTNHHVVSGCSRLLVNGVVAQLKGSDSRNDLALLSANLAGSPAMIRAKRVAVGEPAAVAGYPLRGLLSGFNMTTGNLSSMSGMGGDTRLVQITAPVQPGNSGGPVLDSSGNLMAVVVSKLDAVKAAKLTGDIPQNVNFAISANVLRSFLDANSVDYDTASSDKILATTAIAEKAKGFTVLIECWK